jgi:hypothetical protein
MRTRSVVSNFSGNFNASVENGRRTGQNRPRRTNIGEKRTNEKIKRRIDFKDRFCCMKVLWIIYQAISALQKPYFYFFPTAVWTFSFFKIIFINEQNGS